MARASKRALAALACLLAANAASADDACDTSADLRLAPLGRIPLAQAAAARGLSVGSAIGYGVPWPIGAAYKAVLAREFSVLTPLNEMKWQVIHPERDTYNFRYADCLARFAQAHGLHLRGHTLAWHSQLAPWMARTALDAEGWRQELRNHIRTVVGHFRESFPGLVMQWDVVNEPIADEGCSVKGCGLRTSFWEQRLGPEYIELAFRAAREADPHARLYINETQLELRGPHAEQRRQALWRLLDVLRERQVPLDGIGLQFHVGIDPEHLPLPDLAPLFDGIARRGLDVAVTELDVRTRATPGPEELEQQARVYDQVVAACLAQPRCQTLVLWGFSDAAHWLSQASAAPVDAEFRPKPAWRAMLDRLAPPAPQPEADAQ